MTPSRARMLARRADLIQTAARTITDLILAAFVIGVCSIDTLPVFTH